MHSYQYTTTTALDSSCPSPFLDAHSRTSFMSGQHLRLSNSQCLSPLKQRANRATLSCQSPKSTTSQLMLLSSPERHPLLSPVKHSTNNLSPLRITLVRRDCLLFVAPSALAAAGFRSFVVQLTSSLEVRLRKRAWDGIVCWAV